MPVSVESVNCKVTLMVLSTITLLLRKDAPLRRGACLLCLSAILFTMSTPVCANATDAACFDVQLELRNGYLAVDPAKTKLTLGSARPVFEDQCGLSLDRIKEELIRYLNRLLQNRGTVLEQRVFPAKKAELADLIKSRKDVDYLNSFTDSWKNAEEAFLTWAKNNPDWAINVGLVDVYDGVRKDAKLHDGPLIAREPDDQELRDLYFRGQVLFDLAAPITAIYRKLQPDRNVLEWEGLRDNLSEDILGGLECRLWSRDAVIDPIADYLEMRGISVEPYRRDEGQVPPPDRAGISPERPRFTAQGVSHNRVIISPDPLLEGVMIATSPNEGATVKRILYLLLPSPDYAKVMAQPADFLCLTEPPVEQEGASTTSEAKLIFLSLRNGPGANLRLGRTYMTRRFLAERLRYLNEIGYTAQLNYPNDTVIPGPKGENRSLKLIHLVISPTKALTPGTTSDQSPFATLQSCGGQKQPSNGGQTSVCAPEQLQYDRGKSTVRPETFAGEETRRDRPSAQETYSPERPHQFRLGVESTPTKPLRYVLGYTQTGLTRDDVLSSQFGIQDQPSGDVRYSRDYVAFDTLGRRLQMSLRGFSDFTPGRSLSVGRADERRSGGEGRAKLDLWRDLDGRWAQLDVGASWRESQTEPEGRATRRIGITHLDGALTYFRAWDGTPGSARLEVNPSFILGESNDRGAWFIKPAISGHYHRFMGSFIQWDVRGRAMTTAGAAPEVELPSFGGEDSVRGYKPDAALARTVWALQNEMWFPVRLALRLPSALGTFLRRNVAAALFADVGGSHGSKGALSGIRGGIGVGLRMVWQDYLTFRLDWAHPVGADQTAGTGGQFFFTVTTWPGF